MPSPGAQALTGPCDARARATGYTIVELAVTIAIASILTVVAVPAFNGLIASQRGKAFASELYMALAKTRSTAFALNTNVTISATAGDWSQGWTVTSPIDNSVVETHGPATGVTVASGYATVTYNASGRLPTGLAPAPSFVISTRGLGTSILYQCVSIDLSGRPYMTAAASC